MSDCPFRILFRDVAALATKLLDIPFKSTDDAFKCRGDKCAWWVSGSDKHSVWGGCGVVHRE